MSLNHWFEELAASTELVGSQSESPASSCLKSKVYSALILAMEEDGPLLPFPETKNAGRALCVFKHLVEINSVQSLQYCKVCHAKALGERMEQALIYWPGCPYCQFQNR